MATSYAYFELENFPLLKIEEEIQTVTQLGMDDDSVHTNIRFLGTSEHPDFLKFHVKHETVRKMRVRFKNDYRERIIEVMEFNLFKAKNTTETLVTSSVHYCHEMFRRLEQSYSELRWSERRVDLIGLKSELEKNIRGGWFTKLRIADVSAAGIFGTTVGESDEWERYEQSGECSSLLIELDMSGGGTESVMINRTGTVVLYGTFSEAAALDFVQSLNQLVAAFSQVYSVGAESRRRRKV